MRAAKQIFRQADMARKKKDEQDSFNETAALPFSQVGASAYFPFSDYAEPNAKCRIKAAKDAESVFAAFARDGQNAPAAEIMPAAKAKARAKPAVKQAEPAAAPIAEAAPAEATPKQAMPQQAAPKAGTMPAAAPAPQQAMPQQTVPAAEPVKTGAVKQPKPRLHYEGHRHRLRERFLKSDGRDMPDYELLELLLFRSVPRADTKPLAKDLLKQFGSLGGVFAAEQRQLMAVKGCGEAVAADLKLINAVTSRTLYSELPKRDVFQSWDRLIAYCRSVLAFEEREQFRVLFLDKKNGLICDEVLQTGTVDHTPVYPREVVKRALDNAASAIILVHNHPSGDPTPSRQDILMTKQLEELMKGMNIAIYDHLIISRNGYASLREMDLM